MSSENRFVRSRIDVWVDGSELLVLRYVLFPDCGLWREVGSKNHPSGGDARMEKGLGGTLASGFGLLQRDIQGRKETGRKSWLEILTVKAPK